MSTLTIRRLSASTHDRLRTRAAQHGRSVEAEVRAILDAAVAAPEVNLLLALRDAFAEEDGRLEPPERTEPARAAGFS
ncbi:MAG: toxin-antitoxin system antitoxin subunit [Micrococcales bacterium]|nr:toxin-antitoxin system antitoxin subunit [Micrococcales bacterium]